MSAGGGWLRNGRGEPSRWIAVLFAAAFATGALAAALVGAGFRVTAILGLLFSTSFRVAFRRRDLPSEVIRAWRGRS